LNYKWAIVRMRAFVIAFIYLLYIITLFIHIEFKSTETTTLYILLGFAGYFIVFEIYQISIRQLKYFKDFWNLFDLTRAALLLAYCILDIKDD